jgi:hypothetical protein
MRDYGYKVCFKKQGKTKWKIYLVTNTYDSAIWNVRWYENHSPPDRKTNTPIEQVIWRVFPIKTYFEYKYLWRGCPF